MAELGRWLMLLGLILAVAGMLLWLLGRIPIPFGRLPGDLRIERPHFAFYFPITSCLILSLLLTLVLWLIRRG